MNSSTPPASSDYEYDDSSKLALNDQALASQAVLVEKLKIGTPIFRFAITSPQALEEIGSALIEEDEAEDADDDLSVLNEVNLPWPPDQEGTKTQRVRWTKIKKEFLNKLSEADRKLYEQHARKLSEASSALTFSSPTSAGPSTDVLNPEPTPDIKKYREMQAVQTARFKRLTETAKRLLIAEVKARPLQGDAGNAEELEKKIEGVEFNPDFQSVNCTSIPENAFYNPVNQNLVLCPAMSTLPDESLMLVIAHEVGHAIDPCNCSYTTYQISENEDVKSGLLQAAADDKEGARVLNQVMPGDNVTGLNAIFTKESLRSMEEEGLIHLKAKGIEGVYPFDTTLRCLKGRHGFTDATAAGDNFMVKRMERSKIKGETPSANKNFRRCRQTNEMGEAMADVFGAKVLGRYLKESGKPNPDPLKAALYSAYMSCTGGRNVNDVHPYDDERVEKVLLAEPALVDIYNCKPNPHSICMNKFGSLGRSVPVITNDKKSRVKVSQ